ncbi:MAG: (d)CMP kinase [Rikenellaceae bacterium]
MEHKKKIVIAIDGFSSCGKSTFAKAIATRLGYVFIDTGAMYRAVTLHALRSGAIVDGVVDPEAVLSLLPGVNIGFKFNPERGASDIYLAEECCQEQIRSMEVSGAVSKISAIAAVREKLVALQQQMGRERGVVMDGRDIGTVVFPDAELKIFMSAAVDVRAMRRYKELRAGGESVSLESIAENIAQRDEADLTREISPLRRAEDALLLDNSTMSVEEQMEWFMRKFRALCE